VTTEMTDNIAKQPASGWVCYDGECAFCLRWLRRVERPLLRAGFQFAPLQTDWVKAHLNLSDEDALTEMRLLRTGVPSLGGADAAVVLMRHVWWLWPLWLLSRIPGAMPVFRATYRHIAVNRQCGTLGCTSLKGGQP
jgi:predicted DCC family thiol-disulfide oxidoreductase YuxK